jgi:hypothetical protein
VANNQVHQPSGAHRLDAHEVCERASACDDEVVSNVADILRALGRAATVDLAVQVGEVIYRCIFRGNQKLVALQGRSNRSFRALAAREDVPFGASTLWRSVRIYELTLSSPELFQFEHLGVAHYRAVLGLPVESQAQLLRKAAEERWSKTQIESAAFALRAGKVSRTGRKPVPQLLRVARRLERTLATGEHPMLCDADPVDILHAGEALEVLRRVRECCDSLEDQLKATLAKKRQAAGDRETVLSVPPCSSGSHVGVLLPTVSPGKRHKP